MSDFLASKEIDIVGDSAYQDPALLVDCTVYY